MVLSSSYGYPRIGGGRGMKKALEGYWRGDVSQEELYTVSNEILASSINDQLSRNIDIIGVGSHSLYDMMLDWMIRFGVIPNRFKKIADRLSSLDLYFAMARGAPDAPPLDMTKWYDTPYHNLTPEMEGDDPPLVPQFSDFIHMIRGCIHQAGADRVAVEVIGPVTFALRSDLRGMSPADVVLRLTPLYKLLFLEIDMLNVVEIMLHEPSMVTDDAYSEDMKAAIMAFHTDTSCMCRTPINLLTYYEDMRDVDTLQWVIDIPGIRTLSLDFTRGDNFEFLTSPEIHWPPSLRLGAGVVDGRGVWMGGPVPTVSGIRDMNITGDVVIQPSCPLWHLPLDLDFEKNVPKDLRGTIGFTRQKLDQITHIRDHYSDLMVDEPPPCGACEEPLESEGVRAPPYDRRRGLQLRSLDGTLFPMSTIGSFPQTDDMRRARRLYKGGQMSIEEYEGKVDRSIAYSVGVQDGLGMDVIVHGEAERADMIEYFAEKMNGFFFGSYSWVQSYGSRYVRPPIIYSDISRKGDQPMTTREYMVAQGLTDKPVKGILTGPVTILSWSFPRTDISKKNQAFQIARVIRQEIRALEEAGCAIVQIDEPALRESLPLRQARKGEHINWAVRAFRLATSGAMPETHVVTHFCYSQFEDVMDAICAMDTDQVAIENSRSDDAMVKLFARSGFDIVVVISTHRYFQEESSIPNCPCDTTRDQSPGGGGMRHRTDRRTSPAGIVTLTTGAEGRAHKLGGAGV
eukprot:GHVO01004018.1.p1 GENE.GHVO01004018.1~~GHVO01004018.1.p1  ORF type:complete len:740 (+),score=156.39 GHVO01004018.1:57-2276(+)